MTIFTEYTMLDKTKASVQTMLRVLLLLLLLLLHQDSPPPTTSWWGHLMPAFLTAPRQFGHMPPNTCHLLTIKYHLPTANCHMPPATCHLLTSTSKLPPANCQKFFSPPKYIFCQTIFFGQKGPKGPTIAAESCSKP